jgi:hypothetical protein
VWTFHSESGTKVVAEDEHDCDMGDVDRRNALISEKNRILQGYIFK